VWRKGGSVLSGQTNSALSLVSVTSGDAGVYSVVVSGACGSVSNAATLTVLTSVNATALTSLTNCPGTAAQFSTTPSGTGPFSFVWRKGGSILGGQTNSALSLVSVISGDAGIYSVVVSGACGSVSNAATLTVLTNVSATALTSVTNCPGAAAVFSTTPSGSGPFGFVWRKGGSVLGGQTNNSLNLVSVTAGDAGVYSVVVSGACGSVSNAATLTVLTNVSATPLTSVTNCPGTTATLSTTPSGSGPFGFVWRKGGSVLGSQTNSTLDLASVAAGDAGVYSVVVSGACGSVSNAATLTVLTNVSATPLTSLTNCPGAAAVFSTTPSGSGPFGFVWRKGGSVLSGQTNNSLNLVSVTAGDAGVYSVVVSGACGSVSNAATLTVLTNVSATALTSLTNCPGTTATFSTTPSGSGPFSFVWRKGGSILGGQTNSTLGFALVTSGDAGIYSVVVSGACGSVSNAATLAVLTNVSATALTSLTNCPGTTATFSTTPSGTGPFSFVWRKDSIILGGQTNSTLSLVSVISGDAGVYSVVVSGGCGSVTNAATLTVLTNVGAPPLASLTNCPGTTATFTTTPSGSGPFSFVWRKGGSVLSGQTNNSLNLVSVTAGDAGLYSVVVSGACGSVSNAATLDVAVATTITPLANQTHPLGASATFSTTASGSGPFTYRWRKGVVLLADQTNSVLNIPVVAESDAGTYTVEVTGACGIVSSSAILAIDENSLRPRITALTTAGSNVAISFTSLSGRFYRVEFRDDVAAGSWLTAVGYVAGTGGVVQAIHLGGAGAASRFYRVRILHGSEVAVSADFGANPVTGPVLLSVTFTDSSGGFVTNRFWDFGDGTTTNTTEPVLTHTYTTAATNTVKLTVMGPLDASTLTRTNYIVVTYRLMITAIEASGSNVLVSFTSQAGKWYRVEYADGLAAPARAAVDFVPGTGGIVQAVHIGGAGAAQRFYRVRLLFDAELVPVAGFDAGPRIGSPPMTVTFTDTSSGLITNRFWEFGDGSTTNTTLKSLTHAYTAASTNTVRLTVSGPNGLHTLVRPNYIVLMDQLVITALELSGSNVLIAFTSQAGNFYRIEYASALGGGWMTAVDFVAGKAGSTQVTHVGGADGVVRFYRVRLLNAGDLVPAASFIGDPTIGSAPLTVLFSDTSGGYVTNHLWDFGDGATTNTAFATVAHTYLTISTNTVSLTATGPFGSSSVTRTNYVVAGPAIRITFIARGGTDVTLRFQTLAGRSYRLESTTALTAAAWTTAVDNVSGTGGVVEVTHAGVTDMQRFYRVSQLP